MLCRLLVSETGWVAHEKNAAPSGATDKQETLMLLPKLLDALAVGIAAPVLQHMDFGRCYECNCTEDSCC